MKYKILTNSDESYELASRSARTVKALRRLQVRTSYYADVYRYAVMKEQLMNDLIISETENDFEIKDADMGADEFRDDVAKLLFPAADVENNLDDIDYGEVEEGLDAFLNFIEPRHRKQNALLGLLKASQSVQTASTGSGTRTAGPLKKTLTTETSEK